MKLIILANFTFLLFSCNNSGNEVDNINGKEELSVKKNEEMDSFKTNPPDTKDMTLKYLKGVWVHKNEESNFEDTLIFADIPRVYYTEDEKNGLLHGRPYEMVRFPKPKKIGTVKLFQVTLKKYKGYPGFEHNYNFTEPNKYIIVNVNNVSFVEEERRRYNNYWQKYDDVNASLKFTNYNRLVLYENDIYTRVSEDWVYQKKEGWINTE
jgi:hypothetical protein